MAIHVVTIDLRPFKMAAIQNNMKTIEVCKIPAGAKIIKNDGNKLVYAYDDGKETPCTISLGTADKPVSVNKDNVYEVFDTIDIFFDDVVKERMV